MTDWRKFALFTVAITIATRASCGTAAATNLSDDSSSHETIASKARADSSDSCAQTDSSWEKLSKQGENALKSGRFGDAERLYSAALQEAQKSGKSDCRLAESYSHLAALYQTRGQFNKAEPLLEKAMSARGAALGVESASVLIALCQLGQFYLAHGKSTKSERLYHKVLEFVDKKYHNEQRVLSNLNELSSFYVARSNFSGAEDLVKKLEKLTWTPLTGEYAELAVALDGLGLAYQQANKLTQAEELFKRALCLREKALPPGHLALSSSYNNLATVNLSQRRFAQAEPLFKKSLEIAEQVCVAPRSDTWSKAAGLAQCYLNLGRTSDAEALYMHILDSADKAGASNSANLTGCLIELAQLYRHDGKYPQAEPLLKRALTITERVNGPEHCSLTPILDAYAEVLQKIHRNAEAAKLLVRSRAIRGT